MEGHESHSESGERYRYRNVTVLLSSDVSRQNDLVFMPNTIEMGILKKPDKGQYVSGMQFSDSMSEEDVKKRLILHFPNLENQSFYCASAVDNRTRLEFHGERRVWDGHFMKKTLQGNSALYIFTEMTDSEWSRTLPQRPTVTHTQSKHLAEHPTSSHIPTSSRIPTSSHVPTYPLHSNLNSVPIKRKNDQGAQKGLLMVPPVVSPPVKRTKGNYGHAINQTVPQNQLNKVTTAAQAPVQHLYSPVTQTSMQGAVISGPLPFQRLVHLQQNQPPGHPVHGEHQIVCPQGIPSPVTAGSSQQVPEQRAIGDPLKMLPGGSSVRLQQNQPPEDPVQGQHQIQGIPYPATAGSSQQVSIQRAIGYPLQMPSGESSVWFQQNQPLESPVQGQHQIVLPQVIPSPGMAGSSQEVSVQRAIGELSVLLQTDSGCESSKEDCANNEMWESEESSVQLSDEMTPDWAYTKEEIKFTISFSDPLPCDATSYKADFEGLPVANLTLKNPYTLVGVNPISQTPRKVTVKILKFTENDGYVSFREDFEFTYKEKMFEFMEEVMTSEKNRIAALEGLCKGLLSASAGSDDLNAFRLPEAGKSSTTESDDSKSVKLLTLLIYIAAQNNSLQFVDFIFSTSVGKVVFTHYKHNPTLPEDVARANGHPILGNYLENVNKRLSKERIEDKSETVNWLELKHAMGKKQDQPCNDDVQTPIYPESDKSQRDYDADDEVSNSSSPFSEITDPGCEDKDHDTTVSLTPTDDNDAHPSNQAKAEKQRDQYEVEGQKIESLFTDDVIAKLCPKEGPITGGTEFLIFLNVEGIPEDLTSLRARFKGVGFAYLTHVREGIFIGHTPASEILGKVAVNVVSVDDTWNSPDETEFEYHPILTQELQKLISTIPTTKRNTPLDYQTLNPSRSAGTGTVKSHGLELESFLESDDDQSIYFADDETSICQSPSASEFSNEDECIETKYRDDTEMLEHSRCDDNHGDTVDKLKLSFCSLDDVFDSLNYDQVKSANEEISNVSSHVDQEGASPGVTISPVSVIATVPVAGEVLNSTVGVSEGMANCRAALHSQEPFGFTITAPLSEDRDSAQRLDSPFIEKKIENGKANGKECSAYSVCPLGFGLKEPCSKTKNTECQPCYPGSDYSDSTGMEECIKCDTYSNCLPRRSKKITKCTIFSGHTCDGCEEGYYHHQDLGCDKCSPKCDATTEDEIQACTTKHNRVCAPKRVLPKTPPIFSNDSKGGHPNNTTNDEDDEIPLNGPKLEESKTNQPREENLIFENLWLWVLLMVIVVLVVIGSIGPYKMRSRRNRPTQPEGDVNTHNTEENIALREQTIPLITEGGVDAHDTRETVSLGPRHELEPLDSGGVDAPEPSSEELSRQKALGLDRPIKDLRIKEKKQIKNDLSGKDIEGYFYWQSIAEELDLKDESRGWEGAQNLIETFLKAFGEKEGSTIRGLIEATRRAGPTHCARQLENQFDTAPRNDTTDSVHKPMVQNKANDNYTFVDIPSDPGKENGATKSVYLTPGKGEKVPE